MSVRLVLLGLLRKESLHGYELKHIIESHLGDWTNIAFGSVYFALGKLRDEGFIEESGSERAGNRPARTVYAITARGRSEFDRLLAETFAAKERQYFEIDEALAFMGPTDHSLAVESFRRRVTEIKAALEALAAHEAEQGENPEIPPVAHAIFGHSLAHMRAELQWSMEVLADLEAGTFIEGLL